MPENTLLGRCVMAYEEALNTISVDSARRRAGIAAVLEHLAAEMVWFNQQNRLLTVHELARLLTEAAGNAKPDPDDEPLDWDDHPSLSPADRNPSLR